MPAVLVLKPFLAQSGDPQRAWLVVAMASTYDVPIGFWQYLRVGLPLTLLTIVIGLWSL